MCLFFFVQNYINKTTDEKIKEVCIIRTNILHIIKWSIEKSVKYYDKEQKILVCIKSNIFDLSPAHRQLHLCNGNTSHC